ncbi:hypothetical protein [Desulfobacula sp.]
MDFEIIEKTYGKKNLTIKQMHPNKKDTVVVGHSHYFIGKPHVHMVMWRWEALMEGLALTCYAFWRNSDETIDSFNSYLGYGDFVFRMLYS